jgi:hypothetical protein
LLHRDSISQDRLEIWDTAFPNGMYCDLCNRYGVRKVCVCTIMETAPFFVSVGQVEVASREVTDVGSEDFRQSQDAGEPTPSVFRGDDERPVVMVWGGMLPEEQEIVRVIREEAD